MSLRRGQWVVVGGKNIGILTGLGIAQGTESDQGGGIPVAQVDLVDENGETMVPGLVVEVGLVKPVTVLSDIPSLRRAHLPTDYDPVKARGPIAQAVSESAGQGRSEFKPAKRRS